VSKTTKAQEDGGIPTDYDKRIGSKLEDVEPLREGAEGFFIPVPLKKKIFKGKKRN
jgi:hypothetical protein